MLLLKPHTPFMLECFLSKPEAGLTAPISNATMNIHAPLFKRSFFGHYLLSDQHFKSFDFLISHRSRKFHRDFKKEDAEDSPTQVL